MENRKSYIKKLAQLNKSLDILKKAKSEDGESLGFTDVELSRVQEYQNSFVFRYASNLVRYFANDFIKHQEELFTQFSNGNITKLPIFRIKVVEKDGNKSVVVDYMPNIELATQLPNNAYMLCSAYMHYEDPDETKQVLTDFYTNYKLESSDPRKEKGWMPSKFRSKLKRMVSTSLPSFVTKYSKGLSSAVIRDGCAVIESKYIPPEIKLCETFEDYNEMYQDNGPESCMLPRKVKQRGKAQAFLMDEKGFHPVHFYKYLHPHVQGAYLRTKEGNVLARCLVYRTNSGNYFGRIFTINPVHKEILMAGLKNHAEKFRDGQRERFDHSYIKMDAVTIPGVEYTDGRNHKDWYAPFPFLDNMSPRWKWKFNKETKEFTCINNLHSKDKNYTEFDAGQNGVVIASHMDTMTCSMSRCQMRFTGASRAGNYVCTEDGNTYCSVDHAIESGYVQCRTGGEEMPWRKMDQCYKDEAEGTFWSNREALIRRGGAPVIMELDSNLENPAEEKVSRAYKIGQEDGAVVSLAPIWDMYVAERGVPKAKMNLKGKFTVQLVNNMVLDLETMELAG